MIIPKVLRANAESSTISIFVISNPRTKYSYPTTFSALGLSGAESFIETPHQHHTVQSDTLQIAVNLQRLPDEEELNKTITEGVTIDSFASLPRASVPTNTFNIRLFY
jgi:hypothetical protein